jgi:hypothetical protein
MESTSSLKDGYKVTEDQLQIIYGIFKIDETIFDPDYNNTHICLSEIEA